MKFHLVNIGAIVVLMALFIAACGSPATSTPTPQDASQVAMRLKAAGAPITDIVAYDATTDVNHLLGRPGGYTSKVNFRDSRLKSSGNGDIHVEEGGSIEIWPDENGLKARINLVKTYNEYTYQRGGILVRLSKILTPDQTKVYDDALQK